MKLKNSFAGAAILALALPAATLAEPLDAGLIAKALDKAAEAGQIGGGPGAKEAAKLMRSAEASLAKYLTKGKQIELPAKCTFKNQNLSEGPGLSVTCEEAPLDIELYVVSGSPEVMRELKNCAEKCTGEFELVHHTRSDIKKSTYIIGPFARSLWLWAKPISVKVVP